MYPFCLMYFYFILYLSFLYFLYLPNFMFLLLMYFVLLQSEFLVFNQPFCCAFIEPLYLCGWDSLFPPSLSAVILLYLCTSVVKIPCIYSTCNMCFYCTSLPLLLEFHVFTQPSYLFCWTFLYSTNLSAVLMLYLSTSADLYGPKLLAVLHLYLTAIPRCNRQYWIPLEQEQRGGHQPFLHWGRVHADSGSSPVVINKWRQGRLSDAIANFSDPVYILSRST